VIQAELPKSDIHALAKSDTVGLITIQPREGVEELAAQMKIARITKVYTKQRVYGEGAKVAVWERAPDDETHLSFAEKYIQSPRSDPKHARLASTIIKNAESGGKPRRHAYSTSALKLAMRDEECTIISQSFRPGSPDPGTTPDFINWDILRDLLTVNWPNPLIVKSSCNFVPDED
jgi:hypothetical protein